MTIDRTEALADLQATVDYLGGIVEESDGFDFDTACDLRDAALAVKRTADEMARMLEGQMMAQLEAVPALERNGRIFRRRKKYVERHDHGALLLRVQDEALARAVDKETGVVVPSRAVEHAVTLTSELFLSPSDKAKVSVADKMEIPRDSYVSKEFKCFELGVDDA